MSVVKSRSCFGVTLKPFLMMQKKLNLTKTVRKLPIDENLERAGHYIHDDRQIEVKYDAANWVSALAHEMHPKE